MKILKEYIRVFIIKVHLFKCLSESHIYTSLILLLIFIIIVFNKYLMHPIFV